MASAGGGVTVTTSLTTIFDAEDDGGKCTSFSVGVRSDSAAPVLVNVPGLHKAGEFMGIAKGTSQTFRLNHLGIAKVFAKGDGGSATVDYGVVARTANW